jgi:hypothetical protein
MLKVYVASKARPQEMAMWTALRGAGIPIIASWISSEINKTDAEPTPDAWGRHWEKCLAESALADITIFFAPEGANQCGSLVELGSALQAGREIWIVSDYWWSISHYHKCRVFKTIEACISAVSARMKGEEAARDALTRLHRAA